MTNDAAIVPRPRATDGPGDRSTFALGLILRRAHHRAVEAVTRVLRPLGLEPRHFAVLIALNGQGPMSQSALVRAAGSDRATMVPVVDDLERAGLVTRAARPGDRRVRIVAPTEHAQLVFDQAHVDATPVVGDLVAHLRPGEAEQLIDLLERFVYPDHPDPPTACDPDDPHPKTATLPGRQPLRDNNPSDLSRSS